MEILSEISNYGILSVLVFLCKSATLSKNHRSRWLQLCVKLFPAFIQIFFVKKSLFTFVSSSFYKKYIVTNNQSIFSHMFTKKPKISKKKKLTVVEKVAKSFSNMKKKIKYFFWFSRSCKKNFIFLKKVVIVFNFFWQIAKSVSIFLTRGEKCLSFGALN